MVTKISLKVACAPLALAVSLSATPAVAQEPAEAIESGEAIIVTGTRIRRPDLESANPIVAITAQDIQQSGQTNLTDLLAQTPALFNSETNYSAAGSQARMGGTGVNLLNLRNLGANRTLVLVNGRRHIAGVPGEAAVDINTIATSLVERVDILTGGVSAIYGADGVSGVVNFVTKRDFEGLEITGQNGLTNYGDGSDHLLSITGGTNFAGGRGNIAASYEYRGQSRISFAGRPIGYEGAGRFVRNPDDIPDDPNKPDRIFLKDIRYADTAMGGAFMVGTDLVPLFVNAGEPYDPGRFLPSSGYLTQGGSSTPLAAYQGDLQPKTESHNFNLVGSYELAAGLRLFGEGKYVHSTAYTVAQPSFDVYAFLPEDNAFIPQVIRDAIVPGNFDDEDEGFYFGTGLGFSRDNFDFGRRGETVERDLYRGVIGLEGEVSSNAKFEVSYTYGQNDLSFQSLNNRYEDRYYAALDAVDQGLITNGVANGNIMCRVDLTGEILTTNMQSGIVVKPQTFTPGANSGCVPLNIFGEGAPSAQSLAFINTDLQNHVTLKQHVVNAYISGDFGQHFELPGGAVAFVVGAEYRKESSRYTPDVIATTSLIDDPNDSVLMDLSLLGNETGAFDVWEVFGELNVPILSKVPFAERLEFGAAIRLSDYSTIGRTTTWKVDGTWQPISDIAFRGSYSEAVRAPNITELFQPRQGAYSFLTDPCDEINVGNGTQYREANCRALIDGLLGADAYDSYDFGNDPQSSFTILGAAQGNQNLKEEKARTWTLGAVARPRFVPGLAISFDWYDIRLTNAVNTSSLSQTAEFCVDSPTLDNAFCDNITRSTTTGYVTNYILRPENVAFFETSGADITVSYRFDTANLGRFALQGTLGYLKKLNFLPAEGGVVDVDAGETGSPKWVGTGDITWTNGPIMINYGLNYSSKQLRTEWDVVANHPDYYAPEYMYHKASFTHDIRAEFSLDEGSKAFFLGANNFTNEKPSLGTANVGAGYLGRFMYAGFRVKFDKIGF